MVAIPELSDFRTHALGKLADPLFRQACAELWGIASLAFVCESEPVHAFGFIIICRLRDLLWSDASPAGLSESETEEMIGYALLVAELPQGESIQ